MEKYRIDTSKGMEFGVFSLGDHLPNPLTGERISAEQRIHEFVEYAKYAEQAGIDFFGSVLHSCCLGTFVLIL